jgi:hypothetical protein
MALHGREITRQTGLTDSAVLKELNKVADTGFLLRQQQANQQIFQANSACLIYRELVSMLKKTSGMTDVLVDALSPIVYRLASCVPGRLFRTQAQIVGLALFNRPLQECRTAIKAVGKLAVWHR